MPPAPNTFGRIAAMVLFALSCFGLLLFLWVSFGGPTPLKPKGYRVEIAFPEATQLALQADVRISGVSVGKVVSTRRDPGGNRALATIELEPAAAPLPADTRAMLRTKTLLGETFVELTPGTRNGPAVRDGGRLADARVQRTVEFDEILGTFDPRTRRAFQTWQQDTGAAIGDRGPDLNRALGQLPPFLQSGGDLLDTLDTERAALRALVRNTGVVFAALTQDEGQLRRLVTATADLFATTARREADLRRTIAVLPTFLRESRATFRRTSTFATRTRPVVRLLRAPTRDLAPTVRDLGTLAPDLRTAFARLRRLEPVSRTGLPALAQTLRGLRPALEQTGPFLAQVNPILELLEQNQYLAGDFFTLGAGALADTKPNDTPGSPGHYLRQFGVTGLESAGVWRERLPNNRGNTYVKGTDLADPRVARVGVTGQWDCRPSGGERDADEGQRIPGCWVAPKTSFQDRLTQFPRVEPASYDRPTPPKERTP